MKKIVVITSPGRSKMEFVNALHERTGGSVALVLIQQPKKKSVLQKVKMFYGKVGYRGILSEIYYYFRLRVDAKRRAALNVTKLISPLAKEGERYIPQSKEVGDINSDYVYEQVRALAPDLIVVWGGLIIKPRLIAAAGKAINLHTGYCPYYRGTNCNLNALYNDDFEHIGITIHEVVPRVDAGAIYSITKVDTNRSPRIFFKELNDYALAEYLRTITALCNGEQCSTTPQDISLGRNYLLKDWTYTKQFSVSTKILGLQAMYRPVEEN